MDELTVDHVKWETLSFGYKRVTTDCDHHKTTITSYFMPPFCPGSTINWCICQFIALNCRPSLSLAMGWMVGNVLLICETKPKLFVVQYGDPNRSNALFVKPFEDRSTHLTEQKESVQGLSQEMRTNSWMSLNA